MKKTIVLLAAAFLIAGSLKSQNASRGLMESYVSRLDNSSSITDYQQLANDFLRFARAKKTDWLPYYYAAYCNAKIGWLMQEDPENIDFFADKAEEEIKKAQSLLDSGSQKKEMSEICTIYQMLNQARVFINPATYGPKYGPAANRYLNLALAMNPDNPRAEYLAGWEKYATPKMWGGDKVKAKELLESAKKKLQAEPDATLSPHWGKEDVDELLQKM
jgi:hypothetical protein